MVAGHSGRHGPSVHQNAILASKQGNGFAIHLLHNTGAVAAPGLTSRQETVTPIPAQVHGLHNYSEYRYSQMWYFFISDSTLKPSLCPCRCVSTWHGVHDSGAV